MAALLLSLMLAPVAALADATAPAANPATATAPQDVPRNPDGSVDTSSLPPEVQASLAKFGELAKQIDPQQLEADNTLGMAHDLSPWGMYQNADIIVKIVMIGLAIASIITWTIWIAKGFELMGAKRRLRGEIAALKKPPPSRKPARRLPKKAPWPTCWCTTPSKRCVCRSTAVKRRHQGARELPP